MAKAQEREQPVAAHVEVDDERLLISNLSVTDNDIVQYVLHSDDKEEAVVEALRLGSRVLRSIGTSGDVEMVKREFDVMISNMTANVNHVLTESKDGIGKVLQEFKSESLQKSLHDHHEALSRELEKLFGPESANSIHKQIDEMLATQTKAYVQSLAQVLERTDDPSNPFAKLRADLAEKSGEAVKEIRALRDKVVELVSAAQGVASEREKGTAKGRTFQDYMFEQLEAIARQFGDTAENVADEAGEKGRSKSGDVLVTLNPKDTGDSVVRIVYEAKNRKVNSVPSILSELDEAKENRVAAVAVGVFSSEENMPAAIRPWRDYPGHRFVCVLPEDGSDEFAIRFSYRCARFDALQSVRAAELMFDSGAVQKLLGQICSSLSKLRQMQTKLRGATDAIDGVEALIDDYRQALISDLDEIDRLFHTRAQQKTEAA